MQREDVKIGDRVVGHIHDSHTPGGKLVWHGKFKQSDGVDRHVGAFPGDEGRELARQAVTKTAQDTIAAAARASAQPAAEPATEAAKS